MAEMAKLDQVKIATEDDLNEVAKLYHEVCDHQSLDEYGANWTWGEYPSVESLRDFIQHELIVTGWKDGRCVAAGVLTAGEDDDYRQVDWPIKATDQEIVVLHLFTVHPDYRGTGIAGEMFEHVLNVARQHGFRVLHLDVLAGNVPSEKLYVKHGCQVVADLIMHYDDIGDQPARVLQYVLWYFFGNICFFGAINELSVQNWLILHR